MAPINGSSIDLIGHQLAVRTRRSKGKSKGGCVSCKQRRVKVGLEQHSTGYPTKHNQCDEARPICSRCKSNDRSCVYETKSTPKWKVGVLVLSPVASKASLPPKISVMGTDPESVLDESFKFFENFSLPQFALSTMPSTDLYSFRSEDSRLLAHFLASTSCTLVGFQEIWIEQTVKLAFQVSHYACT